MLRRASATRRSQGVAHFDFAATVEIDHAAIFQHLLVEIARGQGAGWERGGAAVWRESPTKPAATSRAAAAPRVNRDRTTPIGRSAGQRSGLGRGLCAGRHYARSRVRPTLLVAREAFPVTRIFEPLQEAVLLRRSQAAITIAGDGGVSMAVEAGSGFIVRGAGGGIRCA